MPRHLISITELARLLNDRAEALARHLLPTGRREGDEWVEARKARGGLGDSLKVKIHGRGRGVWGHFANGRGGDALDLAAYLKFADDKGEALKWARDWLGLDASRSASAAPSSSSAAPPAPTSIDAQPGPAGGAGPGQTDKDREKRSAQAFALWLACQASLKNTPAEGYLLARGIDLRRAGWQPGALRYHPHLRHPGGIEWPALVAKVDGPSGQVGIHRTWLARRPDGSVAKAPVDNAKMSFGPIRGGAIRISRGLIDGKRAPDLAHAPAGSSVTITEGLEDALTVALACPEVRTLCAVSLANMAAVVLPDTIAEVILLADNDAVDSAAAAALKRAAAAHQAAGRRVLIARPPPHVKDINELIAPPPVAQAARPKESGL